MKYLLLPIHLLRFWFIESLFLALRIWKNLILYIEEDLAVGLMLKLIFVPLFHDSSFVGRILSIIFRIARILMGVFAFSLATLVVVSLEICWIFLPILAVFNSLNPYSAILFFSGIGFFLIHVFTHPHKKTWQVDIKNKTDLWSASWLTKKEINFKKIFASLDVQNLLSYLEIDSKHFVNFQIINIDEVSEGAYELARKSGSSFIKPTHFFISILQTSPDIENFLLKLDLKMPDFISANNYLLLKEQKWRRVFLWDDDFVVRHLRGINRGWLGVPTPVLDSVSEDLTRQALKIEFTDFIGRTSSLSAVINILSQEKSRSVILVGPPGSGKTELVKFLAKKIVMGDAPISLATKRLVSLDFTRLLSGTRVQGELADRVKNIFDEIEASGNVILVIEELHNLGMGEAGEEMNLYSLILPFIESGNFQFIATTENENYSKIIEKQSVFARVFTKVELPIATPLETLEILEGQAINIERKSKIRVSFLALKKAVELSAKLIHDRVLPDSAISVLEESTVQATNGWITAKIIEEVISKRINMPVVEVASEGREKLLNLENEIHQKLIDQEGAVSAIVNSLRRNATALRDEKRPIGSFLFVGPTGVGKTELAKILSEIYFKNSGAFLRFDMSEYQSSESVNKLIGSSGEEGQLTEMVKNKQYALILLDEFEKADPKILTLFLQVLEEGRLTDGRGVTVDFTNTIIIATSNGASLTIAQGLESGKTLEDIKKQVNGELLQIFKPELINRFDDVILFKSLSQEDLQKIVSLKLQELQAKLKEQGYLVEFDSALVEELAKKGFDPVLGARPLRRLIQDTLESKLSKLILENSLIKGQVFKADLQLLSLENL